MLKVVQGGFVFLRLIIQPSIFSLGVVNLELWKPGADPWDGSGAAVRRERRKYGCVVKVVVRELDGDRRRHGGRRAVSTVLKSRLRRMSGQPEALEI